MTSSSSVDLSVEDRFTAWRDRRRAAVRPRCGRAFFASDLPVRWRVLLKLVGRYNQKMGAWTGGMINTPDDLDARGGVVRAARAVIMISPRRWAMRWAFGAAVGWRRHRFVYTRQLILAG